MNAYLPRDAESVIAVALIVAAAVCVPALRPSRRVAIAVAIALIGAAIAAVRVESAGFAMVALIAVTVVAMKVTTIAFAGTELEPVEWLAFVTWPGMRPAAFATLGSSRLDRRGELIASGLRSIAEGAVVLACARLAVPLSPWLATCLALPALSLIVHFGAFNVVAAFWRSRGVACGALFRHPLHSTSLAEFWSRRWNVGYSEMIATVVQRPVAARLGTRTALFASFFVSGLLHELAISVPVHAGYGLPTLYFVLQGALVTIERRIRRPPGRAWTLFWLVAPLPLLFHPPFIRGVIWPLIGAK